MVVASFESVAGLRKVISEKLRHMGRTLREELPSPIIGTSSSIKRDATTSGLRITEHQKQKPCRSNMNFFKPHQPVGAPKEAYHCVLSLFLELGCLTISFTRNPLTFSLTLSYTVTLPLSHKCRYILDSLLMHLIRYPTETDIHMLATQTGLTQNQVKA